MDCEMENTVDIQNKKRAGRLAIASSCCGVTGEITLTDSAVIILFASALGASDMLQLIMTSVLPFFNGLLVIPAAFFITLAGRKQLIAISCSLATLVYALAASSPFFKGHEVGVLISMILLFGLSLPGFISGWFPLLDSFLDSDKRTAYLGKMRFMHQATAMVFLFLISFVIGKSPSVGMLQAVLFAGCIIFSGRLFFISRIPDFPLVKKDLPWKEGLTAAMKNKRLTIFSVYQFVLNLLIYGTIPIATLYLKKGLCIQDNIIVFISGAAQGGILLGYLAGGWLKRKFSTRMIFILLHVIPIPVNLGLFFIDGASTIELILLTVLMMIAGVVVAASSIFCSAEMMSLAAAGNKTMAMAWSGAFFYCGVGGSRLVASFFLNSERFNSLSSLGDLSVSGCQKLFLLYGLLLIPCILLLMRIPAVRKEKNEIQETKVS